MPGRTTSGVDVPSTGTGSGIDFSLLLKGAIALIVIAAVGFLVISSLSGNDARLVETEFSISPNIGLSTDRSIHLNGPSAGHWETKDVFFSNAEEIGFCTMSVIGIQKFTFIPDEGTRSFNAYVIVFAWKTFIAEILLIIFLALVFLKARKFLPSQEKKKLTVQ